MSATTTATQNEAVPKDTAAVFVTDGGFLVPTLLAARQVQAQPAVMAVADIHVFLVGIPPQDVERLQWSFQTDSVRLAPMEERLFLPPEGTHFNQTHISHTTLGRFAIQELLPAQYRHIVYIDGDVQVLGDLAPLVRHRVAPGCIAAAAESLWLCEGDRGKFWPRHAAYLASLGIADPHEYFNAGVLLFRRDTWADMAPRALAYFREHAERCLYHDQSALNALFRGRREYLSPLYNYSSLYASLGLNDDVHPRIVHFTGAAKPWFYPGAPWNGRFIPLYEQFVAAHPVLAPYAPHGDPERIAGMLDSERRNRLKTRALMPWRPWQRRRRLRRYLAQTAFAF